MLTVGQGRTAMWSSFLPLVQRIINASEHIATGHSPSQLMFGDSTPNLWITKFNLDLQLATWEPELDLRNDGLGKEIDAYNSTLQICSHEFVNSWKYSFAFS
jgi:hypothetical protein